MEDQTQHPPSDMSSEEFRAAGHALIDALADYYASLPDRPVTRGTSVGELRKIIEPLSLPEEGTAAASLLEEITPILFEHALHNGHPRFLGYITASAAPLGALADLLAAAVNENCGLRDLSPVANAIEQQTIGWLAELIGYPAGCGGVVVSGGNMANMLGFLAARRARLDWDVRSEGLIGAPGRPRVYASRETHTWIQKAADVAGLGSKAIRWIATDSQHRVDPAELERAIEEDRKAGDIPFLIVGTAGNVSTGAIDPLADLAKLAHRYDLWFHIDGAYGAPAACLAEYADVLEPIALADSIALDPHKWLYVPVEAACTLVRDVQSLRGAFSYRPEYYRIDDDPGAVDYFELGLQNSRAFKALKIWLCLRQAGRHGYEQRIRQDIALARHLFELALQHPELEAGTHNLSVTTFRYRPVEAGSSGMPDHRLDRLNRRLLAELQKSGEAYLSNSMIREQTFLRACVVNFRTGKADIEAVVELVVRLGRELE